MAEGTGQFQGRKILDECPREAIIEAAKSYPELMVNIRRRDAQNRYASCGPHRSFVTLELLSISDFIRQHFGGGRFQIDTYYALDRTTVPVPAWNEIIEGPPKATPVSTAASVPQGVAPAGVPATYFLGGHDNSMPSDQVAMDALQHTRAELAEARSIRERERAEAAERERKRDEEMLALRREMLEQQRLASERQAKAEIDNLKQLIADMRNQPVAAAPKRDILDYVPMITALVPVLTAFISASKDQAARLAEAQTASMTATVNALAKPDNSKPSQSPWALLIPALPAIMPFFMKLMEERSPSKIAELVGTMGESNMTMLSLVGQLVQQAMGSQPDNPWMPIIQQAIENMTSVAQTMATTASGKPVGTTPAPQAPQTQVVPSNEQRERELAMLKQMTPEQLTQLIQQQPNTPKDFLTPAWQQIFLDLHRNTAVGVVAENLANLLQSLDDQKALPVIFNGLFNEGTDAAEILWRFMGQLPVAFLNNAYAQEVCRVCGAFFVEETPAHQAEVVDAAADADEDDDDDDDDEEVKTPVPAAQTASSKPNGAAPKTTVVVPIQTPGGSVFSR